MMAWRKAVLTAAVAVWSPPQAAADFSSFSGEKSDARRKTGRHLGGIGSYGGLCHLSKQPNCGLIEHPPSCRGTMGCIYQNSPNRCVSQWYTQGLVNGRRMSTTRTGSRRVHKRPRRNYADCGMVTIARALSPRDKSVAEQKCNDNKGCRWNGFQCMNAVKCKDYADRSYCRANKCKWMLAPRDIGLCLVSWIAPCGEIEHGPTCRDTQGCLWSNGQCRSQWYDQDLVDGRRMTITVGSQILPKCSQYEKGKICNENKGCRWNGSECKNAVLCENYADKRYCAERDCEWVVLALRET